MSLPEPHLSPHVRQSTDADVAAIHEWLQEQDVAGVHGTFNCNWRLTKKSHDEGRLLVYIDPVSQTAVAYQWGGLVVPGILEVRNDTRGRGIGQVLVEHCLALARQAREHILCIQCKPSTSIPFWQRMGFELTDDGGPHQHYAMRLMQEKLEPPDEGEPAEVVFEWFPERRKWDAITPARSRQMVRGMQPDGEVWLEERVLGLRRIGDGDAVLRVTVNGQEWYCDKAKYEAAEDLGVERCLNGFFIEVLCAPEISE
ncbi:MAG: GNAT family N-acetyltransferase [Burkholderiales bacterium]|nr:GNAT family N-acetyltransferase [Burkholderiales bacterium]